MGAAIRGQGQDWGPFPPLLASINFSGSSSRHATRTTNTLTLHPPSSSTSGHPTMCRLLRTSPVRCPPPEPARALAARASAAARSALRAAFSAARLASPERGMAPVSEAEGQRSGGREAHRCRRDVLDVLGRVLLHRLRLTAGRGVGQGIVVTVAHGSVVRRPPELNASSNASVGKLRKHPCCALGAWKQQRLALGGSRASP